MVYALFENISLSMIGMSMKRRLLYEIVIASTLVSIEQIAYDCEYLFLSTSINRAYMRIDKIYAHVYAISDSAHTFEITQLIRFG